jgi:MerR family transcriptional regulator, thiopeptide resistance regulator
MAYSVNQLATVSGVTVRTLHFYDEIGLLPPAYHGAHGYRFYEEAQLLTLQQILFFRELGIELKEIAALLPRSDADRAATLRKHRQVLQAKGRRLQQLIQTIDGTLKHIEKQKPMKAPQFFRGFDAATQAGHERSLIDRFGESARPHITASKRRVAKWTKDDWERSGSEWDQMCRDLVSLISEGASADATATQAVVKRHFAWLQQFWNPNRESYAGHGQFLAESELRAAYDKYHPKLANFLAEGIQVYASLNL